MRIRQYIHSGDNQEVTNLLTTVVTYTKVIEHPAGNYDSNTNDSGEIPHQEHREAWNEIDWEILRAFCGYNEETKATFL